MKYKTHSKLNPFRPQGPKIQYAVPVNPGKMALKDFATQIAQRSSLTRGDVESVLINFLEEMPTFLRLGMSIQLGDLGTMRLTLSSRGVAEGEAFTSSHIRGVRVVFTPGVALKSSLRHIPFEEEKAEN
ncbi:MAG: HU family DNA-binding protein [Tannerellaceae bacterium]|jgi:predicted histone-like DNA-binding protein|nr:HU family DNA-binding protein [Tannerellaceae bacterium]